MSPQFLTVGRVAQSVQRLTTGWTVRGSNPGGARFSARPDRPWNPIRLLYNVYRVFPGIKYGRGVLLNIHPLLVPMSWKSRAIPLPILWTTTRPVTGTLYLTASYERRTNDPILRISSRFICRTSKSSICFQKLVCVCVCVCVYVHVLYLESE